MKRLVTSTATVVVLAGSVGLAAQQSDGARQVEEAARAGAKVAQDMAAEAQARASAVTPIDLQIVIARYEGEKKVSSLPYGLTVNAGRLPSPNRTRLRMGGQVPLPSMSPALGPDGKPLSGITGGGPVTYQEIGTQLEARATQIDDGRFEIELSVSDSALATPDADGAAGAATLPVIRTFTSTNHLVLRDGQTRQFTTATDRITGEVVRVEVTLRVVK